MAVKLISFPPVSCSDILKTPASDTAYETLEVSELRDEVWSPIVEPAGIVWSILGLVMLAGILTSVGTTTAVSMDIGTTTKAIFPMAYYQQERI